MLVMFAQYIWISLFQHYSCLEESQYMQSALETYSAILLGEVDPRWQNGGADSVITELG